MEETEAEHAREALHDEAETKEGWGIMEVLTRVHCSEADCGKTLEYWTYISVEMESPWNDSYGNEQQADPVLKFGPPESTQGWTEDGNYTRRYYCPEHTKPKKRTKK